VPRRSRLRSLTAFLAGFGALAVSVAGCAGSDPAAITVNGHEFSRSSVERELHAIAASKQLKPYLTKDDGTVKDSVATTWLTGLVEAQVAEEEVGRRHLDVTKADRTIAKHRAAQVFGLDSIVTAFPKWFRDVLRDRYANAAAVVRANGHRPTDDEVRAQYETSVTESCASHRFVSHILVGSAEEAQAIEAQLAAGADFAKLAAQRSTDTTSARSDGDLGCLDGQQLDPAFAAAASALPLGGTSGPVQTQFGWHVIRVRDIYDAVPFDSVKDGIRNDLATSDPAGRRALTKLMAEAKVKVDRHYGRWVAAKEHPEVKLPGQKTKP